MIFLTLFGWPLLCVYFFKKYSFHSSIMLSFLGGIMFLPMASFDLPVLPEYNKFFAIFLGIMIGEKVSNGKKTVRIKINGYDSFAIIFCIFSPIITSISNGLGLYDGIATALDFVIKWGFPYWLGRKYFSEDNKIDILFISIILAGIYYIPFCIIELIFSPQLHRWIYGYHQHSFLQHIRYGGYRPMVFMQHGIMVAFWMFSAFICIFWYWRDIGFNKLRVFSINVSAIILVLGLLIITILCKTAAVWFYTLSSLIFYFLWRRKKYKYLKIIILAILIYMVLRLSGILLSERILDFLSSVFDPDRIYSMYWRLLQEDEFRSMTIQRPVFGWGGYKRGWPLGNDVDASWGGYSVPMVDSAFLILSNTYGFVGLFAFYLALLIGPWLIVSNIKKYEISNKSKIIIIVFSLINILFAIDCLINFMIDPVCFLLAGSLVGYHYQQRNKRTQKLKLQQRI